MEKVFCLFAGRHQIPGNPPAIFKDGIDPMDFYALYKTADAAIPADCTFIRVYVTGLTTAMLAVVNVCFQRGITLEAAHYNRDTGKYQAQFPVVFDHCPFCGSPMRKSDFYCPNCGAT